MTVGNMRVFSAFLPVAAICLGCAPGPGSKQTLEGEWVLEVVETADGAIRPIEGRPAMVTFTGEAADGVEGVSQLRGSGGCNRFFGGYTLDGTGGLTITDLGATRMMCPDSIMAAEDALMANLPRATVYLIAGSELIIEIDGGKLRFTAAIP